MRISDWSSDVCSSDLRARLRPCRRRARAPGSFAKSWLSPPAGARSFCVCGGPEQRPVTWLRLLPYPLAIAVTKSRRSEQALDEAVVVELDAVRRGHARQARHGDRKSKRLKPSHKCASRM